MTRDEAKTTGTGNVISVFGTGNPILTSYEMIVDKIYDDFESRTCENCIYGTQETAINSFTNKYVKTNKYKCYHIPTDSIITHKSGFHWNPKDFGCNKFERKKDD